MELINNFLHQYKRHLFHIVAEEYLGWITRSLPGLLGISIRSFVYQFLLKNTTGFTLIYAGVYLTHTYGISLGHHFSVNTGAVIDGRGGITIGNYVMIGPHACLISSSHQYKNSSIPATLLGHQMKPLIIGNDVWVGANVTILSGLKIGDHVIIGANAVVTKDIPANSIVGGVPAALIKKRYGKKPTI